MQTTVEISKHIFELQFKQYVNVIQNKHKNKKLNNAQIRFLKYPFITSVFWAKNRKKFVKRANMELYYSIIFKQLSINFQ